MATGKLTLQTVKDLEKTGRTEFLWDEDLSGFGVRMTSNGVKSYVYQYRLGGREAPKKRYTIGRHGSAYTPDAARKEAKRLALMVGQGIDPVAADDERRRQAVDLAFSAYVDTFTTGYLKSNWKDWEQVKRLLEREAVPVLKRKALPLITKQDVAAVLDRLADRPSVARLMHAVLRKMFKWAAGRGSIERSPMEYMDAPSGASARDRSLDDDELATVWNASTKLGFPFGPLYRLLIVTGQRREEVSALSWDELDEAAKSWTLPASRAKNGHAHIVPLNALAVAELNSLAAAAVDPEGKSKTPIKWPKRGLVLSTTGETAVSGHSRGKVRLDRNVAELLTAKAERDGEEYHVMPAWRVHDFRRTVATGLQRLGIRWEVTEAVLNHISGSRSGIAGVYQRHDWKNEKRTALDAWGRHIESILSPSSKTNVRNIQAGAAA
jgi:integrase